MRYIRTVAVYILIFASMGLCDIQGVVKDALTRLPLENTNITIEGTERGTITDKNGYYHLENAPTGKLSIKASYMGYENLIRVVDVQSKDVLLDFDLSKDIFYTQQVVVTATRNLTYNHDVPVVTELVTRADIEERGAENVSEAIQDRAGLLMTSSASTGQNVNINGIDAKHILVLEDGIPVAGKVNNRIDLSQLGTYNVDHIEIVKGPGSALYGTEAMGGVINVITNPVMEGMNLNAHGKYGTGDLMSGHFTLSGGSQKAGYAFGVVHTQGGIEQNEAFVDISNINNEGFNTKLRWSSEQWGDLVLKGDMRSDDLEYNSTDSYGLDYTFNSQADRRNISMMWNHQYDNLSWRINGFGSDYIKELKSEIMNKEVLQYIPVPVSAVTIDTTTEMLLGAKSDFTYTFSERYSIDWGYDYIQDTYESDRIYNEIERDQHGVFAQLNVRPVSRFKIVAGGRYDKVTDVDGFFSPRISGMYNLTPDLKLRASWGKGFRLPSFTDLYINYFVPFGSGFFIQGNPDLKPEESTGFNAGFEYLLTQKMMLTVMGFRNEFENLINDTMLSPGVISYRNIDKATYSGAELQARYYLMKNLTTVIAYNYSNVDQEAGKYTVTNIAPHTASFRVEYRMFANKLSLSVRDQFWGKHDVQIFDTDAGEYIDALQKHDTYNLLDFSANYILNRNISVRAGVTNLTDYKDKIYGPFVGRRVFITFDYNI